MTGEGRRCERVAYLVRHCRHQRQLRAAKQVQLLDIPAYTAEMDWTLSSTSAATASASVDKAEDEGRRRRAGHPVQCPRTLLYQYVQPRGRKAAGQRPLSFQSAGVCRAWRAAYHLPLAAAANRAGKPPRKGVDTMRRAVEALDEAGYGDMTLSPGDHGKIGQLGTLTKY